MENTNNTTNANTVNTTGASDANNAAGAAAAIPAKGLTTKKIILILGALVIVCAAVIVIVLLLRDTGKDIQSGPVPGGMPIVDESNLAEIKAELEEKVAKGMFETYMSTTWTFPDGKSPSGDAVMGNSASNNYPFWFTVTLKDTGDVVYTSSLLPVGSQLAEIVLEKDLGAGTYPAVVTIHMVEENGAEVESNMGFNITLIVKN
jgi:hypothetical protein